MRHELEVYDRVLLDVPCSSDRHVLKQVSGSMRERKVVSSILPPTAASVGCTMSASRLWPCADVACCHIGLCMLTVLAAMPSVVHLPCHCSAVL
jgi:hypothetical protein